MMTGNISPGKIVSFIDLLRTGHVKILAYVFSDQIKRAFSNANSSQLIEKFSSLDPF